MNKKFNVLAYAISIGLILYVAESIIFYFNNRANYSFLESLLTDVPLFQILSRLLILVGFIVFGFIVYGKIKEITFENEFPSSKVQKESAGRVEYNFLAGLSFQIRTPLNAIIGFSELLKKPGQSAETKEKYLDQINSSSKYLLLLINNISEIAKIESNELTINRIGCNISRIIEEQFHDSNLMKNELGKPGIDIEIKEVKAIESFNLLSDPIRLKQVLSSLIENSLYLPKTSLIKIGYSINNSGFVEFFVSDNGIGFQQERIESILSRYNKLTDNQNMPFDGYVLRLAISKSLIKLLGGDIKVESQEDKGTTVYFTIPYLKVLAKSPASPDPKVSVAASSINWSDRLILIAEDVDSNFIYLEELLRPTKIKILWAKNGKEAVEKVKANPGIELVLMDILMPEMDGYQASREIKAFRNDLPIIAQTACAIEGSEKSEQNRNFDSFLTKPIWSPQLLAAIDKYIY